MKAVFYKIFILLILGCLPLLVLGQGVKNPKRDSISIIPKKESVYKKKITARRERIRQMFLTEDNNAIDTYTHGFLWGLAAKLDGWAMTFRWLRTINPTYSYHVLVGLSEIVDARAIEYRPIYSSQGINMFGVNTVDAKTDILYPIRIGLGGNKYIVNKASNKGVFLQLFATGGISLGFQKPYNLEIIDPVDDSRGKIIDYSSETADYYTRQSQGLTDVKGRTAATFFSGWDKISLNPGLFVEAGLRFGFSNRKNFLTTINVGLNIDYYFNKVPLSLTSDSRNLFVSFFVGFEIGKIKLKK